MSVQTGEKAPTFALPDEPGHVIDLANRIGERPIVLLFFPLAFSPVCTTEMCTLRDDWSRWSDLGADVLAISVDSPFVTRRFRDAEGLPFPVLSDFNKVTARAYGALHADLMGLEGVAKRAAFVIDRGGNVAYRWISDDPKVLPDFDAIAAAVEAAR